MKIIITESQYTSLLGKMSTALRRRITDEDFEYLDKLIFTKTKYLRTGISFEDFINNVMGDTIHEFVSERKGDEIDTYEDPPYGIIYDEDSFDEVAEIYWGMIPLLKDMYHDKLYKIWKEKYDI